ncbi:MAG: hypothetical protein PHD61_10395 [Bacteroidales bacterium]|nr:hypothetical protein [Lentimicrobiaceae bacterium]MDD5695695.1 hypothetical protein [Bacteroidales bacterium]
MADSNIIIHLWKKEGSGIRPLLHWQAYVIFSQSSSRRGTRVIMGCRSQMP